MVTLFVLGLRVAAFSPLSLECEDCQSGTNGGPTSPHCRAESPRRHLAGLARRGLDLLRGADHNL